LNQKCKEVDQRLKDSDLSLISTENFSEMLWPCTVVPKIFRAVSQIKVVIMSNYPQYFTFIAHNIEQPGPDFSQLDRMLPIRPRASPAHLCNVTRFIEAACVVPVQVAGPTVFLSVGSVANKNQSELSVF